VKVALYGAQLAWKVAAETGAMWFEGLGMGSISRRWQVDFWPEWLDLITYSIQKNSLEIFRTWCAW
jgi:hypothetical protein